MAKKSQSRAGKKDAGRLYYGLHPWRCVHHGCRSELFAFVDTSGKWECVAEVLPGPDATAEELAIHIVNLVNDRLNDRGPLEQAFEALDAVLQEGLTFTTEQEAEHAVDRLKKLGFESR